MVGWHNASYEEWESNWVSAGSQGIAFTAQPGRVYGRGGDES